MVYKLDERLIYDILNDGCMMYPSIYPLLNV